MRHFDFAIFCWFANKSFFACSWMPSLARQTWLINRLAASQTMTTRSMSSWRRMRMNTPLHSRWSNSMPWAPSPPTTKQLPPAPSQDRPDPGSVNCHTIADRPQAANVRRPSRSLPPRGWCLQGSASSCCLTALLSRVKIWTLPTYNSPRAGLPQIPPHWKPLHHSDAECPCWFHLQTPMFRRRSVGKKKWPAGLPWLALLRGNVRECPATLIRMSPNWANGEGLLSHWFFWKPPSSKQPSQALTTREWVQKTCFVSHCCLEKQTFSSNLEFWQFKKLQTSFFITKTLL